MIWLRTPTGRRQPAGYLQAWPRIWIQDDREQIQHSGQSKTQTQDRQIASPTCWPLDHPASYHNLTSWYVLVVLGESWWWSHFKGKCGFPLAEERKKRKTFFSHMAGSMGSSVQGVFRSRGLAFQSSVVFVAFRHCLTFPAHPPCVFWVAGFQVVP